MPSPDFVLRFAALMHDVGKPRTRRFEPGGGVSFHHHEVVGAKMTRKRMQALRFSNRRDRRGGRAGRAAPALPRLRRRRVDRLRGAPLRPRRRRPLLDRLHKLTRADCTTRNRRKAAALAATYDDLEERIARLSEEEELAAIRPDLDGNEIMRDPRHPARAAGRRAYRHLLELRLDRGPLPPEEAEAELRAWYASADGA